RAGSEQHRLRHAVRATLDGGRGSLRRGHPPDHELRRARLTGGRDNHSSDRPGGYIVLAFDFGLRRIGVATGNAYTRTASPLQTLVTAGDAVPWNDVDRLVADWRPAQL